MENRICYWWLFREAKIEIALPQRELHLRSIEDAIMEPLTKT